jgi:hypothetical protein
MDSAIGAWPSLSPSLGFGGMPAGVKAVFLGWKE